MLMTCSSSLGTGYLFGYETLRTSSSLTEIKAVELTDARRWVNMCLSYVSMYDCRVGLYIGTVRADVAFKKYLSKDTSLFVCLYGTGTRVQDNA